MGENFVDSWYEMAGWLFPEFRWACLFFLLLLPPSVGCHNACQLYIKDSHTILQTTRFNRALVTTTVLKTSAVFKQVGRYLVLDILGCNASIYPSINFCKACQVVRWQPRRFRLGNSAREQRESYVRTILRQYHLGCCLGLDRTRLN